MKYDHLLFDLDNTILDFTSAMIFAFKKTIADHGIAEDEDHLKTYRKINKKCWDNLEKGNLKQGELRWLRMRLFLEKIESDVNSTQFTEAYHHNLSTNIFWVEDAQKLIAKWANQFNNLTLVTNGFTDIQKPRLEKSDLNQYFQHIIISDEIGVSKPHKGFFDYTFEKLNHPNKERTLIIGDNLGSDIRGGKDYGIHTCWLNPHVQNKANGKNKPTFMIRKLEELENYF